MILQGVQDWTDQQLEFERKHIISMLDKRDNPPCYNREQEELLYEEILDEIERRGVEGIDGANKNHTP